MELLKYVNTIKKYRLPELVNKKIAVKINEVHDLSQMYFQLRDLFTNMHERYMELCKRYIGDYKGKKPYMAIVRTNSGKIAIILTSLKRVDECKYEKIELEEIDFGIQIKSKE
jgi:hypothetical protein